ncbi:hypothetical protein [Halalkalibacter oceani]
MNNNNNFHIKESLIGLAFGIVMMIVVFAFIHFVVGIKAFS